MKTLFILIKDRDACNLILDYYHDQTLLYDKLIRELNFCIYETNYKIHRSLRYSILTGYPFMEDFCYATHELFNSKLIKLITDRIAKKKISKCHNVYYCTSSY